MEERINQALVQIEKDLKGISSARNQVEMAVKASTDLQSVVSEYISSVKSLCVGLQAWEASLRAQGDSLSREFDEAITRVNSTCTEIINSFSTVVEQTSTDFKNKAGGIVEKFTEQNKILTERVLEMNALKEDIKKTTTEIQAIKESLAQISKDLKDSQENQDALLNDIKLKIDEIPDIISSATGGINEKVNTLFDKIDNIGSVLSQVYALSQAIKNTSEQIHSTLHSSTESLLKSIESSKNDTAKSIKFNRWLIILGIIIIAVLQFVLR